MRYGPRDKFWVCVDAGPTSEIADVLYEASLADLELQFRGGLSVAADNPTIFTSREEAEAEAHGRMLAAAIEDRVRAMARRVGEGLRRAGGIEEVLEKATSLEVRDEKGELLLWVDLAGNEDTRSSSPPPPTTRRPS